MKNLTPTQSKIMERRIEIYYGKRNLIVSPIYGSGEHRSAESLVNSGIALRTGTIHPSAHDYSTSSFLIIEDENK